MARMPKAAQEVKVFWFFSSEKNSLPSPSLWSLTCRPCMGARTSLPHAQQKAKIELYS
jgi:hypothetical protein